MRKMRNFRDYMIDRLQNPEEIENYLKASLEEYENDKKKEAFLLALRTIIKAKGGFSKLAEKTNLNRQNLYRALSNKGNPRLGTLDTILNEIGFRLSVEPIRKSV